MRRSQHRSSSDWVLPHSTPPGCFRTSNLGALLMELGFRAATAHLENR